MTVVGGTVANDPAVDNSVVDNSVADDSVDKASDGVDGARAPSTPDDSSSGGWNSLLPLLQALFVAFLIVTFFANTVGISGDSMQPTLRNGERAFVPKYEVWLHRLGVGSFGRGDVVYFRAPAEVEEGSVRVPLLGLTVRPFFIKRVVAVAGDTVRMEEGALFVNGARLDESYLRGWGGNASFDEVLVPPGHMFVLGDNRGPYGSVDSRRFGPIPTRAVAGRAAAVVWPLWLKRRGEWRWNGRVLSPPPVFDALSP